MANDLRREYRPLFPAGAVARYVNSNPPQFKISDFEFTRNFGSGSESTDPELNVLECSGFKVLSSFLEACIKDYLDAIVGYRYDGFEVVHSWINRTPDGGCQRLHFHGNSVLSGVYYLQASRENAPLIFEKTEMNTSPYLAVAAERETLFNANRVGFPAETGVCYIFPSQIRHGYDVPNRGGERISLAFNVMLGGIGRFYRM